MAVITPPSIDALPAAPDPADRATFNTRAYPWSAALGPFSTQLAAVAANVEHNAGEAVSSAGTAVSSASTATTQAGIATAQAAAAAAAAASASNAANVNGTSTDSESIPTAIGQQRTFTMVESSRDIVPGMFLVAAVTASPTTNWVLFQVDSFASNTWTGTCKAFAGSGTFSAWTVSLSSARGPAGADAVVTTPSLALSGTPTLTAGNNGYTGDVAAGTAIALDTLATLGDGWSIILVPATGAVSTVTADFGAGAVSRSLATPTMLSVKLVSGVYSVRWIPFGSRRKDFGAYGAAAVFLAAGVSSQIQVVALSATLALAVYVRNSDSKIYAVALSIDAGTGAVTPGTPVLVENVTIAGTTLQLVALSATDAVVAYAEGTNSKVRATVLQVLSGTAVTTNTIYDVAANTAVSLSLAYLSATKLAVLFVHSSSLNLIGHTLDISGTAITVGGSNSLVGSVNLSSVQAAGLSATVGVIIQNTTSTAIRQFSVSGSTITMGGDGFSPIGITDNGALLVLSATQFLAHLDISASAGAVTRVTALFELDGTNVNSRGVLNHASTSYQRPVMLKQAADQVVTFRTSLYPDVTPHALDLQDGRVVLSAVGKPIIPPRTTMYFSACLLSATRALVVYTDPANSNYGTAKVLNLGSAAA